MLISTSVAKADATLLLRNTAVLSNVFFTSYKSPFCEFVWMISLSVVEERHQNRRMKAVGWACDNFPETDSSPSLLEGVEVNTGCNLLPHLAVVLGKKQLVYNNLTKVFIPVSMASLAFLPV